MKLIWNYLDYGEPFRDYENETTVCISLGSAIHGYVKDEPVCGGILPMGDRWWLVHHGKEIDGFSCSSSNYDRDRILQFVKRNLNVKNIDQVIIQIKGWQK